MKRLSFLVALCLVACGKRAAEVPSVSASSALRANDAAVSAPVNTTSTASQAAALTDLNEPLRVSGDSVTAPVAIKRVEIDFKPCLARKIAIGLPIIEAVIDKTGVPQNVRLLKPLHPCVETQVLTAVKQWRFRPGTHRGEPVSVIYNMTVNNHYR